MDTKLLPDAGLGHNKPPVTIPNETEMLDDLQRRYPEPDKRLAEWEGAFAEYPDNIPLDQEDVAQNLQDLLGQVRKESKTWTDSFMKNEKGPLNKLIKVVGNFFTGRVEKADKLLAKWSPVHQDFLDKKKAAAIRAGEEEAERQRESARQAAAAAEAARKAQEAAEARAAEERRKEQEAREAAERAQKEREEAEARAAAAREAERKAVEERRLREKAEKETNTVNIRAIKPLLKEAEDLNNLADAEEANEDEAKRLDAIIQPGGLIGELARPVAGSLLLDDDQKVFINNLRTRLDELRTAVGARFDKKEQERREAARAAEKEREDREAAERGAVLAAARKAEEEARQRRQQEEAAAKAAAEERKRMETAAREARDRAQAEDRTAKTSGREAKTHETDADRSVGRAERVETRLEKATDADLSRVRGELGTVGGLAKSWKHYVTDPDALKEVIRLALRRDPALKNYAELFGYMETKAFTDVLNGAAFRFMQAHQGEWERRERVDDALAGVVFTYEQGDRIVG